MINKIKQHKKEIQFIIKCLLIMGLICLCLYQPMMKIFENPQLLRNQLQSFGLFGQIIFVGIVILQVIFVFLPGEIVEIMAGFIYGPFVGLLLCLIGSAMGSLLIYTFVKKWGQNFIQRFISLDLINQVHFLHNSKKEIFYVLLFSLYLVHLKIFSLISFH